MHSLQSMGNESLDESLRGDFPEFSILQELYGLGST